MDISGTPWSNTGTSTGDNLGPELARLAWWARALRAACTTLRRTTAEELPAITIGGCPDATTAKPGFLSTLAERIADEHGVKAEINSNGRSFTVRLCRREGSALQPGA